MDTLKLKILNYESEIFNLYSLKRIELIDKINKIEINKLNKDQLLNYIENLKNIIDPIKTSISFIDDLQINSSSSNATDIDMKSLIVFYFYFKDVLNLNKILGVVEDELEETEETEESSDDVSSTESSSSSSSDKYSRQ